jgi:hypothetical protein
MMWLGIQFLISEALISNLHPKPGYSDTIFCVFLQYDY